PPGEAKALATTNPDDPDLPATKTDPDTLPVLPTLSAPTGQEKYDAAIARAFLLLAEKKDADALASLKEAQTAQDTEFVKTEIARVQARISRAEAAQKAADDIKVVIEAGKADEAAKLSGEALLQYGDSDQAETFAALKQQADALLGASLDDKARTTRFLDEAEVARKADNLRAAVLSYEQAVANGADPGPLKETYEGLRTKLVRYDENRTKAAELRKDPYQLEHAVTALKVAADNWDTPQVRQELSEAELALTSRRDRVAVVDFEVIDDIGVPRAGHAIAEDLVGAMRPRFDVVERGQVRALLEEMKLDQEALSVNDTGRTEFGRLAKARYVVLGSVSRLGGIHVNARLVDTQTGLVVQTARIVASTPEDMSNRLPALGRMLQMNDDEKRAYEKQLAEQARPVAPPPPTAELPPPPAPPAAAAAPVPPPAPIVMYTPRPPVYGQVTITDFGGFRTIEVGAAPPPPVVVVEAPLVVRDRAFFVAVEVGDNCFRRGDFRLALRHFEFALTLNPGHADLRLRVAQCRPLCPPPMVVVPVTRPRLVVLPFAEFRDPYQIPSSIPPELGLWTADAFAPYLAGRYDVVDKGELFWWMGRLGLTMRDVLTNPAARLCLGRALGARFFLMGALREVASFDVTTHVIDAELNGQVAGAGIRVNNAAELRYRLGELASLMFLPPPQQVVVIQQQQVVQRQVVAAQVEFRKGNFSIAFGMYKEVLATNPNCVEARQMMVELEFRQRRSSVEAVQVAAWQRDQAAIQRERERQIALAAAAQGAREQARRDLEIATEINKHQLAKQQALAQQNLILQAQLAHQQNNLERRVTLLESAAAIKRDDALVAQLVQARAELAAERQKRLAAEQATRESELKRQKDAELAKVQTQIAVERQRRETEKVEREKAEAAKAQAEYDRFVDQGRKAMEANRFPIAVSAFQNARRLKPSPEAEQLVSNALTAQAKADAEKKGAAEKARLDAQLAKEEERRKQAEADASERKAKYQASIAKAREAMNGRQYAAAATSFRLASQTMQTDEAAAGLKQAETELAKVAAATDAEAKKKAEEARKQAAVDKRLTEGRTALATKQYEKAIAAFRAAAELKPGDVEIQKALTQAELARDEAVTAARPKKDPTPKTEAVTKKSANVDDLLAKARAAIRAKDLDGAAKFLADASAADPTDPDIQKVRAEYDAARRQLAGADAEAKKKQDAYLQSLRDASTALADKKYAVAIREAKEALAAKPGDPAATKILNDAQKALDAANATAADTERKKDAYDAAMKAGRAAYAARKFDEAIRAFEEAVQAKPGDPTATQSLAIVKKAAAAASDEGKKKDAYDTAMTSGRAAMAKKDYDAAIRAFSDALKADPGDPTATALLKQAREADAAPKAPAVDPKRKELYEAWMDRAEKLMAARRFADAVEAYQNALRAMPDDTKATKGLAEARAAATPKKDPTPTKVDPIPAKDPVVPKKEPVTPKASPIAARIPDLLKTAQAQENGQRYAEAARTYQEVLKLSPTNADAKRGASFCEYMDRGTRDLAAGKLAEAAASFEQALRIDPQDENARRLLQQARPAKKKK
ncbi:MAG TPA: tetratricopeptide repeat protein, partial [Gemmataceae bacterium]|nr:tetratricopeptide repeat protein [Gemmataceae bacterium]